MEDAIKYIKRDIRKEKANLALYNKWLKTAHKDYLKLYKRLIKRTAKLIKSLEQAIQILELNSLYPVLEDAERSEADSTHGEASNH